MRRCVITGAASGIGRALAFRFGNGGYSILGIDKDREAAGQTQGELESSGISASFLIADLCVPSDLSKVMDTFRGSPPCHVVIHNAGTNCVGQFEETSLEDQKRVLSLNLIAPMKLTADLLSGDHLSEEGAFVFISSLSRFVSYSGASVYAASKDGISSYARSLYALIHPRGQHVLTVYPGPTRTEHARRFSPDNTRESKRMDPDKLADLVFAALEKKKNILVPGLGNRFFATLGHFLPFLTERAMKKAILSKLPTD